MHGEVPPPKILASAYVEMKEIIFALLEI
jgi:hypothetical protein